MKIILLFSKRTTLQTWEESGILKRELLIYYRLIDLGHEVTIITYGGKEDLALKNKIGNIKLICNNFGLPQKLYYKILPLYIKLLLKSANNAVLITQQSNSVKLANQISLKNKIPFIMRCGYSISYVMEHKFSKNSAHYLRALEDEKFGLDNATKVVVTTNLIKERISELNVSYKEKIKKIPNYVDTNLFKPGSFNSQNKTLFFVGYIGYPKNLNSLLHALKECDIKLVVIAKWAEDKALEDFNNIIKKNNLNVELNLGTIPNEKIPDYFRKGGIFILPSLHEGNPKVLLEAMSCGMPVIGSDVPGINNLINHKKNGYLCGTDSKSISKAINTVIKDKEMREKFSINARKFIIENFSIDLILDSYENIFRSAIKNNNR